MAMGVIGNVATVYCNVGFDQIDAILEAVDRVEGKTENMAVRRICW